MKLIKILAISFIIALISGGGLSIWIYRSLNMPKRHDKTEQFIDVEEGATSSQIIGKLISEGVLENGVPIQIYLRVFGGASELKAGEYKFKSPITALEILEKLKKGQRQIIKLTIPEGWTRFEIARRLDNKLPWSPPKDEKAILHLMNDVSQIKHLSPNAKNLEGYLYPMTYHFSIKTSPKQAIRRMTDQFKKTWKKEWTFKAQKLGKTPQEIVTIASLIENESKIDSERELVASVIYNRLEKQIALGIDATNVYIAKLLGKWDGVIHKSDLEVNHPYNTRKILGLPPGPISSVSTKALEAALSPAKTDYLFYVLNVDKNDGSHNFYESASEFERGKAKYQRWLVKQRKKKIKEVHETVPAL